MFFARSPSSRQAGQEVLRRIYARTQDRDEPTTWATRQAQYDAVCAWGIPDHALLQRLGGIDRPVFAANGDSDPMILPHYSYLIAGLVPRATAVDQPGRRRQLGEDGRRILLAGTVEDPGQELGPLAWRAPAPFLAQEYAPLRPGQMPLDEGKYLAFLVRQVIQHHRRQQLNGCYQLTAAAQRGIHPPRPDQPRP